MCEVMVHPDYDENGLPVTKSLLDVFAKVYELLEKQKGEHKEKLNAINKEIADNKGILRKMFDSLNA